MANAAAQAFLTEAAEQAKGAKVIAQQMYDDVIHEAGDWSWGEKEQFLGELSVQYVETLYTDAAWVDKYNDVFLQNSDEFGAIVQIINTEMPEVRANRAWDEITSGTTTIGSNIVYLPVVKEQLTGGTSSWALPYAFTGTQMNTAFKDAAGLRRFENNFRVSADNSVRYHLARMTAANRNNYILEKLAAGNTATKINKVNLVEEYCRYFGVASMTAQSFLSNTNGCLRSVYRTFKRYKAFLTDMSTLFTLDATSTGKFIPSDRFAFIVLADLVGLLETELYSTTFHDAFVTLKGYREIPSWQGLRTANATLDFNAISTIDAGRESSVLTKDEIEINKAGVVALMVDRWAIMHTIVRHRMGVQRDDIKDITLFEHQFTDRYINNLMLNGIVFTIEDYSTTPPTPTPPTGG